MAPEQNHHVSTAQSMSDVEPNGEKPEALHCETIKVPGAAEEEVVFTDEEANAVRRKLDLWIMPVLMITYALQYWDKVLLGQAVLFNLAKDLHLTSSKTVNGKTVTDNHKYANCALMFYVGYIVATYPMALLTQRFPTAKVIAATIFLWSVVLMSTPACTTYPGLMVNRFFLGVTESGVAPTFTVYVTFWFTRREQALRSPLWYGVVGISMMFSPLISWGVGHINGSFGASTWKYMYLVAGSISLAWSLVVLWVLPDDPHRAKWLNPRQRSIVLARLKENNAGTTSRHFKWSQVIEALKDFNTWSNAFFVGATGIPNTAFATFSALIISALGFTKFQALLLTMPFGAICIVSVLISGWITRKLDGWRFYMIIILTVPSLVGSLICFKGPRSNPNLLYAGVVLMPFQIAANAISVAMASSNVAGHTKKSTVSGITFIGYCLGNIAGPLVFTSTPGPKYAGGFTACVVILVLVLALAIYGRWHLGRENNRRDAMFGKPGESHALEDMTDRENMDFRYML